MNRSTMWFALVAALLSLLGCNIGASRQLINATATPPTASAPGSPSPQLTDTPAITSPTETEASQTPAWTATVSLPQPSATAQNPLVTSTAYCWSGPTNGTLQYELVSSIKAGTRVELLGIGIVAGWWVVRNPRYGDPCWIQQQYVQIDPASDLSQLKTFGVPPTPTATP